MNFLAWLLAISCICTMSFEAVVFHRATVCRQVAWQKSHELTTRASLSEALEKELAFDSKCKLKVSRLGKKVSWLSSVSMKIHQFELALVGSL